MFAPIAARLALALLVLLSACEEERQVECSTAPNRAPSLRVVLRDADSGAAVCDAKVKMTVEGTEILVEVKPYTSASGACAYGSGGPPFPAVLTIEHAGYQTATKAIAPYSADACGDTPELVVEIALAPVK